MSDFAVLITEAKVEELHRVYRNAKNAFLCFTRLADPSWVVSVTDGVDVWRLELDYDELDSHRDLSGVNTMSAFLTKFRDGFASGNLSVSRSGTKVTLTVGTGASAFTFDLYETKAADKRTELQTVLFRLADQATDLDSQLNAANVQITNLKAQKKAGGDRSALFDLGPKKGANPAKAKPKKTGMSVLNPTSRKRKAAKGVEFD
ncbi:uncharacterized protein LOC124119924 [Haliotis rufescens]|uniref:uncharacterized protein LOC124119924 n=1 Tax=Haliotis rufescens TaxID=6454 RepID=UPI001EAFC25A|nr:uncharacterized protein LOC124119924 [Haliotis rufescens]